MLSGATTNIEIDSQGHRPDAVPAVETRRGNPEPVLNGPGASSLFVRGAALALANGRRVTLAPLPVRGGHHFKPDRDVAVGECAQSFGALHQIGAARGPAYCPQSGCRHRIVRGALSPALNLHCPQSPMSSRPACRDGAVMRQTRFGVAFERNCEMNRNA